MKESNCFPFIYGKYKWPITRLTEIVYFKIIPVSDCYVKFINAVWPVEYVAGIETTPNLTFSLSDKVKGQELSHDVINFSLFSTPGKLPNLSGTNPINWEMSANSPLEVIIEGQKLGTPYSPPWVSFNIFVLHKKWPS